MHSDCHASILPFWSALRFKLARFKHDCWFDAFLAQHAISPDLSLANADDAINIAAATTLIPIILTMVSHKTGAVRVLFNR